jgi:hypothetical protein
MSLRGELLMWAALLVEHNLRRDNLRLCAMRDKYWLAQTLGWQWPLRLQRLLNSFCR